MSCHINESNDIDDHIKKRLTSLHTSFKMNFVASLLLLCDNSPKISILQVFYKCFKKHSYSTVAQW